jgi:hypothetical protein
MGLDLDPPRIDTDECVGDRAGEHVATLGDVPLRVCAGFVPKE